MDEELKISVRVQRGREVRKLTMKRYLPPHKSLSRFFEDFLAEMNAILEEILRR